MVMLMPGRYMFALLAGLGYMISHLGRDCLRVAIIPMKEELELTVSEVSHVLGGYYYSMIFTMMAGGPLADMLGGKWLLLLATLLAGVSTVLVPLLASLSVPCLVTGQVLYGIAGGLMLPALGSMIARWEPRTERGRLAAIIYIGIQVSAVISPLVTGYVSQHQDWRLAFYILGSLPLPWALAWLILVTDLPANSRLTSGAERDLLAAEISTSDQRPALRDIPVRSLLTSGPVTGMVVANVAIQWVATHTSLLLPQYLNDVLHLPLHHTSLVAALPYIGSCLLGLLSTLLDSRLLQAGLSPTSVRKICSSLCLFGFAALSVAVPFIQTDTSLTIILTTAAYSMTGFRFTGSWNNPLDIAPNFAGTLTGLSGMFCYLTAALVPHTTHIMASLVEVDNIWTGLFLLVCTAAVVANMMFLVLGTAEIQHWNTFSQDRQRLVEQYCEDETAQEKSEDFSKSP